jgi:hypothetical protein
MTTGDFIDITEISALTSMIIMFGSVGSEDTTGELASVSQLFDSISQAQFAVGRADLLPIKTQ